MIVYPDTPELSAGLKFTRWHAQAARFAPDQRRAPPTVFSGAPPPVRRAPVSEVPTHTNDRREYIFNK